MGNCDVQEQLRMAIKNKHKRPKPTPISLEKAFSLEDLDRLSQEIEIRKSLEIQRAYNSDDPHNIMKAVQYIEKQKNAQDQLKSFLFDPDISSLNTNNYRVPTKNVSYQTLKRMARTPVIRTVIGTRVDQVAGFAEAVNNEQEKGWMIRRKKSIFDEKTDLSAQEKKEITAITKFIMEGGSTDNKWQFESFEEYLRQMTNDSLSIDQICVENVYSRGGKLVQYYPVDGATIRLVDDTDTVNLSQYTEKYLGYWPKYCQVWQEQVCAFYYPWEMTFGVRNKVTDILANGYGISELEDMVNIVTWLLFGMQYNGNFFSQGSNPKGFFSIEGNVPPNALNDFKQMWRNTISGVQNSHKVPVLESGSSKVNWIDMQQSNKDMEFDNWLEFLIVISCCMYKIDPSECGFNLKKSNSQIFGQDGQKQRLRHSQTKGLTPILKLIQRIITKYIVEQLKDYNGDKYEYIFCGVETEDQQVALDMDVKKIGAGLISLEDGFRKYSDREFNPETDTILNAAYIQIMQQKAMGGGVMNSMVDNMNQDIEEVPESDNPFEKALLKYIERPEQILNEQDN